MSCIQNYWMMLTDFSLFKKPIWEHLVDLLDKVNLSEEELEKLKKEAESSLEKSIQKFTRAFMTM